MKNLVKIVLLLHSIIIFGQSNDFTKEKIEIENYVKLIDSTEKNYREILSEGPIIYYSLFKKNGGWSAYNLHKENEVNFPLRIKYGAGKNKMHEDLKIYYKNGKIIFADLTIAKYKRRWKIDEIIKKQFYFIEDKLIYESNSENKIYNLQFLINEEKGIRQLIQ